ncbi:MAG: hypothetical protein LAP13_27680, partial [Acidobacteriia bacterium]|nr:hypothetical protein [Terriglobia bacterium]
MDELWENLLKFDEHTWTADRAERDPESLESIRQDIVKDATVTEGKRLLDHVLERSLATLADHIPNPSGTLVVFNPLNWSRSSLVVTDLDKGLDLVDLATHQNVPFEVLSAGQIHRRIRFLASDVPALGYKCYAFRPAKGEPPATSLGPLTTIESPYYRVILDPTSGAVKGIYDKELQKELVDDSSPYRFNQYLYVTGGDEAPNRLLNYNPLWPLPKLVSHGAENGRLVSVSKSPQGIVAHLESSATNTPRIETEIILFDKQKKIEFINHVHKTKVYTKEGVYFAFP